MNYRSSIMIVCLAMLGLAVDGWGQDWDKIAFISDREGSPDIWIMNVDGSDPANLTQGRDCASPAWSPDGTQIAYIDNGEIWLMDADSRLATGASCCYERRSPVVGSDQIATPLIAPRA